MTQQLEKFGVNVPDERFILDHEHLHGFVEPVLVKVNARRGVGWPRATPGARSMGMAILSWRAVEFTRRVWPRRGAIAVPSPFTNVLDPPAGRVA
jgi:hypothetical protein